jgi:hypothetical protein
MMFGMSFSVAGRRRPSMLWLRSVAGIYRLATVPALVSPGLKSPASYHLQHPAMGDLMAARLAAIFNTLRTLIVGFSAASSLAPSLAIQNDADNRRAEKHFGDSFS